MERRSVLPRFARWALAAALFSAHALPPAGAQDHAWTATWTASPQPLFGPEAGLEPGIPSSLADQTVRQILHVSVASPALRIVLSNTYGEAPLIVGEARVARADSGVAIVAGSDRAVSFGRETRIVIPPGASVTSDPIALEVPALSDLTVSIYIPESTPLGTFHWSGGQTSYVASGNVTAATSFEPSATLTPRLLVSAVLSSANTPSVAAFGDSITDGSSVTLNSNQRWPDLLAARLAPQNIGTINAGISGNQLLSDGLGVNAIARFERDVLSQPGVASVIVLLGINDIGGSQSTTPIAPAALIAGYRQLIAQAHTHGVRILGATITPFEHAYEESGYYTPEKEQIRTTVNTWIREGGELDGVVDFDLALRDPEHPTSILPAYDSGDHLHPSDAGYRAMADAVDLTTLLSVP